MKIAVLLTSQSVACFHFSPADRAHLQRLFPEARVTVCGEEEEFLLELADAEIALVWSFRQEWFALAPQLRWLATPAAGRDYFEVTPPEGVFLSYGAFHGEIMAETVLAWMLAHSRGVVRAARLDGTRVWPRTRLAPYMKTLRGAHLVVLGFGRIGRWIGRLAKPFGVRITGISRSPGERPAYFDAADRLVPAAELDSLLPETDHLVLALPRTPETDNILSAERISLLPHHAVVYNIGRGNAVEEEALARALIAGDLAAAYLDVFQREPLSPDSPLRIAPNILLVPHLSAVAPQYMALFLDEFAAVYRARVDSAPQPNGC